MNSDVLVIGGGTNGLMTATLLAKAGRKVVVLERTDRPGGCARTTEIAPGFRCPTLAHAAAIDPAIVRDLALERHGLTILRPEADVCAPTPDGRALVLWRDTASAIREIQPFSTRDAEQYPRFLESFRKITGVLRAVASSTPP
jgi:phytoene dehydrogenase-like protein